MKSFIVSLLLLIGVITGVTLLSVRNIRAVSLFRDEVTTLSENFLALSEDELRDRFSDLFDAWETESPRLSYSVNRRELASIDTALQEARGALYGGDKALFLSMLLAVEAQATELYELVGVRLQNII